MLSLVALVCLPLYFIAAYAEPNKITNDSLAHIPIREQDVNIVSKFTPASSVVYLPFKGGDTATIILKQTGDSTVDYDLYFDSPLSDGHCIAFTLVPDNVPFATNFKCVKSKLTCDGCMAPMSSCYKAPTNITCITGADYTNGCHDTRFASYGGSLFSFSTQKRLHVRHDTVNGVSLTPTFGVLGLNKRIIVGILSYRNNRPPQAVCAFVTPGEGTYGNFSMAPVSSASNTRNLTFFTGFSLVISALLSFIY
ncbi:hypothetical protein CLU79DRAFT_836643 [Phycomyces nitens]|nr:hypothetical protein CLU79DRAFT_836643 [Phycomyces nitens]